jgi:hypothetical protein
VLQPLARALALSASLAGPLAARSASPGEPVEAARRLTEVVLDGRLEEPAWAAAPVFDGFVQRSPAEGQPPSERTEVRVLYDDRTLFVGVTLHDSQPRDIRRPLGRRDNPPAADAVTVFLDSRHDGRTAFVFALTASGVLSDGLLSSDDVYNAEWDAVWQGVAAATKDGWSAELAIPLAALRFQDHGQPVFGFAVRRYLGRLHEEDWSADVPRNARGQIARFGTLVGLAGLEPVRDLELVPYLAARLSVAPQYSDTTRPRPRLASPNGDVGLDLKTSLGRGLSLQGTVNPDFGQVEADQVILNLSTFEAFFPEKRPFFTQGMDLFRAVAPVNRDPPHQLFYSRRIGLDAPILAAAKLTGAATNTLQVGLVEAFVAGASSGRPESDPDRRFRFVPERPLWLGPRAALPQLSPAPRNFLAGVVRWQPDARLTVSGTATSALLTGPRCSRADSEVSDDDTRPRRCDVLAGNAAAVDLDARSRDGAWYLRGQLTASQAQGGPPLRTLADGTRLSPGDLGLGAFLTAGRGGGEPWRFDLDWEYTSPRLDLNAVGYQRTQNEQLARGVLRYVRPGGGGPFLSYDAATLAELRTTTDGRGLVRGGQVYAGGEVQLRSFDWLGVNTWLNFPYWDVREIDQATVSAVSRPRPLAVAFPASTGGDLWYQTDPSRAVIVGGDSGGGYALGRGPLRTVPFWWLGANVTVRSHSRLETRLDVLLERNGWSSRYVSDDGTDYLFGELVAPDLSLTLRQLVVLAPRLTLQGYAQLFTSAGRYARFTTARPTDGRIARSSLRPASSPDALPYWDNPDFRRGTLNLNVVLRWEYRLGSTLYVVYARSQEELGYPDDAHSPSPPYTLRPIKLGVGPTTDSFLVKWSYWFDG